MEGANGFALADPSRRWWGGFSGRRFDVARAFILRRFSPAFSGISVIQSSNQGRIAGIASAFPPNRRITTSPRPRDRITTAFLNHRPPRGVELARAPARARSWRKAMPQRRRCGTAEKAKRARRRPSRRSRILEILEPMKQIIGFAAKPLWRRSSRSVCRLAALERDMEAVIRLAVSDALAYDGGRGCAVHRELWRRPFTKGSVGPETVAA